MKRIMILLATLPVLSLSATNIASSAPQTALVQPARSLSAASTAAPLPAVALQAPEIVVPAEVQAFYDQVKSHCVSVIYDYTIRANDTRIIGKGTAQVQPDAYRLTMNGLEVYSDGKTLWMNDPLSQEVMIDVVEEDVVNLLDNPILFVSGLETMFDISIADGNFYNPSTDFTVPTNKVVMIPNQTEEILFIDVHYNKDFTAIVGAVIYMRDGSIVDITIPNMSFGPVQDLSHFVFNTDSLPEDYVITDLR